MKKLKTIPKFRNEDEEREFWATQSPLDYFLAEDFKKAVSYAAKQVYINQLEKNTKKDTGSTWPAKRNLVSWSQSKNGVIYENYNIIIQRNVCNHHDLLSKTT